MKAMKLVLESEECGLNPEKFVPASSSGNLQWSLGACKLYSLSPSSHKNLFNFTLCIDEHVVNVPRQRKSNIRFYEGNFAICLSVFWYSIVSISHLFVYMFIFWSTGFPYLRSNQTRESISSKMRLHVLFYSYLRHVFFYALCNWTSSYNSFNDSCLKYA